MRNEQIMHRAANENLDRRNGHGSTLSHRCPAQPRFALFHTRAGLLGCGHLAHEAHIGAIAATCGRPER